MRDTARDYCVFSCVAYRPVNTVFVFDKTKHKLIIHLFTFHISAVIFQNIRTHT